MPSTERLEVAVLPLADVPQVEALLHRLGLGSFDESTMRSFPGRNDSWAGVTSSGTPVFVKRLRGEPDDVRHRLHRIQALADLLAQHPSLRTPACLGIDETTDVAAFLLLDDASTGAELIGRDAFTVELANEAGRMVGALHRLPVPAVLAGDASEPHLPPTKGLTALPLPVYLAASAAELELWDIIHTDGVLATAIGALRDTERAGQGVLVHGDLRLDQFLLHAGRLHLTDLEECRVADPARDIGAFAGECLFRGVLRMSSGDSGPLTEREVVANGAQQFERLRPLIEAFWSGYLTARPEASQDLTLPTRAVRFAGWHMFDRIFAAANERGRLSPLERAVAGVGRSALLRADQFVTTVGLGGTS